jgi:hypothetical protein
MAVHQTPRFKEWLPTKNFGLAKQQTKVLCPEPPPEGINGEIKNALRIA